MSAKPSLFTNPWAATGAVVTPSGAAQNLGFVPGNKAFAQYLNWILNLICLWLQYLSDGAFTGGVSVDTLKITTGAGVSHPTAFWNYPATNPSQSVSVLGTNWTVNNATGYLTGASVATSVAASLWLNPLLPGDQLSYLTVLVSSASSGHTISISAVVTAAATRSTHTYSFSNPTFTCSTSALLTYTAVINDATPYTIAVGDQIQVSFTTNASSSNVTIYTLAPGTIRP